MRTRSPPPLGPPADDFDGDGYIDKDDLTTLIKLTTSRDEGLRASLASLPPGMSSATIEDGGEEIGNGVYRNKPSALNTEDIDHASRRGGHTSGRCPHPPARVPPDVPTCGDPLVTVGRARHPGGGLRHERVRHGRAVHRARQPARPPPLSD